MHREEIGDIEEMEDVQDEMSHATFALGDGEEVPTQLLTGEASNNIRS